jgi:antitoxin YefM
MKTIPVSEARARLNALIDDLTADDEEIALTKHGRPVAYVRSAEAAERAEETAFWLAQPGIMEDIEASRAGTVETSTMEDVRRSIKERAEREGIAL